MRKLSLFLVAILFAVTGILAQTPAQFKYQAVLRNADGTIMANEAVTVDISILQGSASGSSVFDETHNVTTTAQGLINLNIGSVEDLSVVDWGADTYFIEISVNGTTMGTSQLLSVPYAMTAKTAETVDYSNVTNTPTIPTDVSDLTDNTSLFFDRDYNSLSNLPTLFDGQWSSLSGTAPDVSIFNNDAGYLTSFTELDPAFDIFNITSPADGQLLKYDNATSKWINWTPNYLTTEVDGSVTNEIQDLNLTSNTLTITNNASATSINLSPYLDDKTVAFTNGTGINVTGTYPNFTVTNTAPDQTVTITAGDGITVTGTYPDFTVAQTSKHYVGELYGGGIVFYVYDDGQHGLIASLDDLDGGSGVAWSATDDVEIGASAKSFYDGASNTAAIVAQDNTAGYAATLCNSYTGGGFTDWFLPASWQLNLLYNSAFMINEKLENDGDATTNGFNAENVSPTYGRYWSSTECTSNYAWYYYFDYGYSGYGGKGNAYRVRAVRAF